MSSYEPNLTEDTKTSLTEHAPFDNEAVAIESDATIANYRCSVKVNLHANVSSDQAHGARGPKALAAKQITEN